ncbi:DUF7507 domain-containing protein [Serinibacter arcticus]|uniref:DUF7927 domain-containing protein n=1 Tax=Serinibacter arcticus TaxID=1655435 RepID=UPI001304B587|nr:VWA domain-containing protein [Serinibacter arcticus]
MAFLAISGLVVPSTAAPLIDSTTSESSSTAPTEGASAEAVPGETVTEETAPEEFAPEGDVTWERSAPALGGVERAGDDAGAVAPMAVPIPAANEAVISVRVGGDRLANGTVQGLAGVTLALWGPGGATTAPSATTASQGAAGARYNPAWTWTTCVSDAAGDCSFVVPIRPGAISATGVPQDTRFWVVQEGAGPPGWYSNPTARLGGFAATPEFSWGYRFRTDTLLRAGQTYLSTTAMPTGLTTEPDRGFMRNLEDSNAQGGQADNIGRSTGVWNQSRANPPASAQCGLDVAIVTDTSGSLGATGIAAAKAAMDDFVDAFRGTPSRMSVFSFSTVSPGGGASNHPALLPVATAAQAAAVKAQYAGWASGGGTNWDRGLAAAATSGNTYDVVVLLTDGNPTVFGPAPGSNASAFNSFQDIDAGIFSANQLKATGARVLAVGVGPAVTPATGVNLRAVSGTVEGSDYFRAADFDAAAEVLSALADSGCQGSLQVRKMIVPQGGTIAQATPAPAGWEFNAATSATGVSIAAPTSATTVTGGDGRVNFGLQFDNVTSGTVQVLETQQTGYQLVPVGTGAAARNAVCTDASTGAPVAVTDAGSAATPGFTVLGQRDVQVLCTIYNTTVSAPVPGFTLTKSSDPVSGTSVQGGDTITYTVTGTNTGTTALDPVTITDDLSGVLDNATLTGAPTSSVGAAPTVTGTTLTWNGSLAVGGAVTLTYTVTLDDDVAPGTIVNNVASGSATPPGLPPITPPPVETEHPVPGFELTKASDPVSGTSVTGGSTITYTVTGTNTGATVLDPVVITDDLAQVLNNATLTGTPTASAGAAPTVAGTTLTWNGTLPVGGSVVLTYTVTLDDDVAPGTIVNNVASGSATPPGLPPITPPPVETEHPVPGLSVTKSSDPVSGTQVLPGDSIDYTLTFTNTGATPVAVNHLDSLLGALDDGTVTTAPTASPAGALNVSAVEPVTGSFTIDGTLAIGQTVTVTYTVTVNGPTGPFGDGNLVNVLLEGDVPPTEPPGACEPALPGQVACTEHPIPGELIVQKGSTPPRGPQWPWARRSPTRSRSRTSAARRCRSTTPTTCSTCRTWARSPGSRPSSVATASVWLSLRSRAATSSPSRVTWLPALPPP